MSAFLNNPFELQWAICDIPIDKHTFLFGLGVCGYRNRLGVPIQSVGICCHVGNMMLSKKVSKLLHCINIIGHNDIDKGSFLGQTIAYRHSRETADSADNRNHNDRKVTFIGYDVLGDDEIDVVLQSEGNARKHTSVSLN